MLPDNMPSVLVIDDQQFVTGPMQVLLQAHGYTRVYCANEPEAARHLFHNHHIDILVSDIVLGKNQNGIDLVRELKEKYSFVLIFISGQPISQLQEALPVKPDAYLVKPFSDEQIITTIATAWNNKKVKAEAIPLTEREHEILHLICKGKSDKEIAEILFISQFTVQTHRANIREKFGVKSTKELLIKAYGSGFAG